ncbi:MAG: hypothetical protein J6B01_01080 [Ruminococcus sp.]|nr:hypothetical protein [Ruminococcus sp.]
MNTTMLIPTDETLIQHISESLIELGIAQKYKGFTYVKDVIFIWMNTPIESDAYKSILKIVGQKYSIGPMSVNSAIKNALDSAWFCGTLNKNHELFGYLKSNQNFPPLPSEFVVAMATLMKKKQDEIVPLT